MPRESLNEFEQLVLLAILRPAEVGEADVHGGPTVAEIERRARREGSLRVRSFAVT